MPGGRAFTFALKDGRPLLLKRLRLSSSLPPTARTTQLAGLGAESRGATSFSEGNLNRAANGAIVDGRKPLKRL
jgi:hypothetical protein